MKKTTTFVLLFVLIMQLTMPFAVNADVSDKFTANAAYAENQFNDVKLTDWFYPNVKLAFELGIMKGTSEHTFNPSGNISIAETLVLACRLHSIYYYGKAEFSTGDPWFEPYVDYAVSNGIISGTQYKDYEAYATRAQFATILASAFPDSELVPINSIEKGAIPDVSSSAQYADAVYKLYNAGILTGNDGKGTFAPQSNIERSAVAAIATRMTDAKLRKKVTLGKPAQTQPEVKEPEIKAGEPLTPEQISEKCADAVFYIETYGLNGELNGSGSGFFVSTDGFAVTNFHVIGNTVHLVVYTNDGEVYDNVEIIDGDSERDLALLKVEGEGFPCVNLSSSATVKQGQKVYAIGSPKGFYNTMSEGIVSNPSRDTGDVDFIQLTAPIDHGSSGGALFNEYGVVVGVTSSGLESKADINFAVPIKYVNDLDFEHGPRGIMWDGELCYPGFECVLDFGTFSNADLKYSDATLTTYTMVYDMDDFYDLAGLEKSDYFAQAISAYKYGLECNGMTTSSRYDDPVVVYTSDYEMVSISLDPRKREIIIVAETAPGVYKEYSNIPDFGWCSGLPLSEEPFRADDGGAIFTYKWSDYYTMEEFDEIMWQYFDLLEEYGYKFMNYDDFVFYFYPQGGYGVCCECRDNEFKVTVLKL